MCSRLKICVQLLALHILHHQKNILWTINRLKKSHNALMTQTRKYLDLSQGLFLTLRICELSPIILFDCDALATRFVSAFFHKSISPLTD